MRALRANQDCEYIAGVDIGGTFTDCVLLDNKGVVTTAKSPSTPSDFSQGMIEALTTAAEQRDLDLITLCNKISILSHGTTVGTNAIIERKGARVGLITTKGHEHAIHIMRGSRGISGKDVKKLTHFPESQKPEPIVPKHLIKGVSERVDCFGDIVSPLNELEVNEAISELLNSGVETIAICFLWSFKYPDHERRVRDLIKEKAPEIFVTCSSELAPKWGEYERTTAAVLNSYIGPVTAKYLVSLKKRLIDAGYTRPLQIAQCGGGTISLERAIEAPLLTLDSGPVCGVMGSKYLGETLNQKNIITTDVGGTSFDVGIIRDGSPVAIYKSNVQQYDFYIPKIDIEVIGSGGGSIAHVEPISGALKVGPSSAGAEPGPICYGKGGGEPTVTDAALILGYLTADGFAGGAMRLDYEAALNGIKKLAYKLDMDPIQCAAGIVKIAEFQMADLIRKMTVKKGLDPRDFVLYAFGGAGPMHAAVYAFECGVSKVIIPQRQMASTWCAFGAAGSDLLHIHEIVDIQPSPFELDRINAQLERLRIEAIGQMKRDGINISNVIFDYSMDLRHRGQINEVELSLEKPKLTSDDINLIYSNFFDRYEKTYGRGSSFKQALLEIVTYRVRATANTRKLKIAKQEQPTKPNFENEALLNSRKVFWWTINEWTETTIIDGAKLLAGNIISGPAIIQTVDTSIVIHPGRRAEMDQSGNILIT